MPRHFARTVPFEALLQGLEDEVSAGNVNVTRDGPLALYKYSRSCAYDKKWTPISRVARGLVLDLEARTVVATPFPKFFNYGEPDAPGVGAPSVPAEPFVATEKMDGSLGIVFYHAGRWRVATPGSFRSTQAQWAEAHLHFTRDWLDALTSGDTYLFEIIYPENRIVVTYDFSGLVLLAAYEAGGTEYSRGALLRVAADAGERVVEMIDADTAEALVLQAKQLGRDHEGFVLRFESGYRLKVKGEEYCRLHRLVSGVTPLAVWELMVEGGPVGLDSAAHELPEEFRADFHKINWLLAWKVKALIEAIRAAVNQTAEMDDKTLGLWLIDQTEIPPDVARWIFPERKGTLLQRVSVPGSKERRKLLTQIRPTGNRLEGYEPSSAVTRFTESEEG